MKVTVYNQKGNKTKTTIDLADNIFSAEINSDLMAQGLYVYQMNQRQGTQKTKGISEVSGGGKKPWKQKTPDRARQGSTRSPIWVGGGDAHPISPRNWGLRFPKKMKRGAIFSALSEKVNDELLKVVDLFEIKDGSFTKQVQEIYSSFAKNEKLLIVTKEKNNELVLGSQSLDKVNIVMSGELNIFDILNSNIILVTADAVDLINTVWGKTESSKSNKTK